MKNSLSFIRTAVLAAAFLTVSFLMRTDDVRSQVAHQAALIEEFTGTWCQFCPRGTATLDSMKHHYGDDVVIVSWHNGSQTEEMRNKWSDTVVSWFGISGYPGCIVHRLWNTGGLGYFPQDGASQLIESQIFSKEPLADVRIVNAKYDPVTRFIDFDIDFTPFDKFKASLPSSDTSKYQTTTIFTEDGLIYPQINSVYPELGSPIIDFVHNDVGRGSAGKVLGDDIQFNTKTTTVFPVRKHYRYKLPVDWNANKIRLKTFASARFNKTQQYAWNKVIDAKQTGYVTSLPSDVSDMVYVITPNNGGIQPLGDVNIYWGKGGAVDNVKLEYTDNGTASWNEITASTSTSPFVWTPPVSAGGKQIVVRASWATNGQVNGSTQEFSLPVPPKPGVISITKPAENDTLVGGSTVLIAFTQSAEVTPNKKFEYTLDGETWVLIGNSTVNGTYSGWKLGDNVSSSSARVRITDDKNVTAMSGVFVIIPKPIPPKYLNFAMTGITGGKINANTETTFSWTTEGSVGAGTIQMSSDNKATWTDIGTVTEEVLSKTWTTPDTNIPSAYFRITNATGVEAQISTPVWIFKEQTSVKNIGGIPTAFRMSTNYPNPASVQTTIKIEVPERAFVALIVRNELGAEVTRLVSETLNAGVYEATLDTKNLAAGTYHYTLESGDTKLVGKMSVVK